MFEIFGAVNRIKRRLKRLDGIIRMSEVMLKSGKKDKIDAIKAYNRSIKRNLKNIKKLLLGNMGEYDKVPKNRSLMPSIIATINSLFTTFKKVDREIKSGEIEIKSMMQSNPATANAMIQLLLDDYSEMLVNIDYLEEAILQLSEKKEELEKEIEKEENLAGELLSQGTIYTKSNELKRLATSLGYELKEGPDHTNVYSKAGRKITEIARHKEIPREIARKIMRSMAAGRLTGIRTA